MKEKIKYFNPVQIITNILLIGTLIGLIITKEDIAFNLFWFITTILLLGNVWFIAEWGKRGSNADIKKSKEVSRSFDDITTGMMVFYSLIYLGIMFSEYFVDTIKTNLYVAIGFYVLTLLFELFIFISVDKAVKDTDKVISDNFPKR